MADRFANKVIVISGAGGNLGATTARLFANEGAKLVLLDRHTERCEQLISEIGSERGMVIATDVTNEEAVADMVRQTVERFGQIDGLVHTVGGFAMGTKVYEGGVDVLDKQFLLNAKALYITCGQVAKYMVENNVKGTIVAVVSRAAVKGGAAASAYTASKAAALRIIESLAAEVADMGIRVNAVSPSVIDTPANREAMSKANFDDWVTAEELAASIAFLSSDASSAIYGTNLEVYKRA